MSKYIDLELALNELLRMYEEDVEKYNADSNADVAKLGIEIPEIFDYYGAREALRNLPTIDIVDL